VRPETAFQNIHIDVVGELTPHSSRGHKYLLCAVDVYSRWGECFPLKTLTAKETCDRLMELFLRVGLPSAIISDNATNMVSGLNKELYKRLEVEIRLTTPFHPKGNGIAERLNQTMKNMLHHIFISDEPRNWDLVIPYLMSAYRELPHSTTGLSPYQMVYGKFPRGPLSILRDSWVGELLEPPQLNRTAAEYLETVRHNLELAANIATVNSEHAQKLYVNNHNKNSRNKSFEVGDSVVILMPDSTNKMLSRWIGPATVVLKVSDNSYNVLTENGAIRTLHADKLRFFNNRVSNVGVVFEDDSEFGKLEFCVTSNETNDSRVLEVELQKCASIDLSHLSPPRQKQLRDMLISHRQVFSDKPGFCNVLRHRIDLIEGFEPKAQKPYRIPDKLKSEVDKIIDGLLTDGKIRPSNSPFAHPIMCVAKKDSTTIRLCCHYKYVNSGTVGDAFPMPHIDDVLRKISDCYFL
jgi:Integrase core domain